MATSNSADLTGQFTNLVQIGITIGYASTVSRTGIVVAPPLFGLLADTASYQAAWLALVAATLVGMLLILAIHEPPAEER